MRAWYYKRSDWDQDLLGFTGVKTHDIPRKGIVVERKKRMATCFEVVNREIRGRGKFVLMRDIKSAMKMEKKSERQGSPTNK